MAFGYGGWYIGAKCWWFLSTWTWLECKAYGLVWKEKTRKVNGAKSWRILHFMYIVQALSHCKVYLIRKVKMIQWWDISIILAALLRIKKERTRVSFNCLACQFSSVSQLCPTFYDPMDCSTPGLPVHHQLLESTQTNVHWVGDAIQPSHPLSSPSPPTFSLSQHQGLFKWVSSSHQVVKVLEFQPQHQSLQWRPRTDLL